MEKLEETLVEWVLLFPSVDVDFVYRIYENELERRVVVIYRDMGPGPSTEVTTLTSKEVTPDELENIQYGI